MIIAIPQIQAVLLSLLERLVFTIRRPYRNQDFQIDHSIAPCSCYKAEETGSAFETGSATTKLVSAQLIKMALAILAIYSLIFLDTAFAKRDSITGKYFSKQVDKLNRQNIVMKTCDIRAPDSASYLSLRMPVWSNLQKEGSRA